MNVRPYVVLGTTQLTELQTMLADDLRDWMALWFGDSLDEKLLTVNVSRCLVVDCQQKAFRLSDEDGGHWAVYSVDGDSRVRIMSQLLSRRELPAQSEAAGRTVHELMVRVFEDLTKKFFQLDENIPLSRAEQLPPEKALPEEEFEPGRGIFEVKIDFAETTVLAWLPVLSLVSRFDSLYEIPRSSSAHFYPAAEVLSNQRLSSRITLGVAELSLVELMNLNIGDVVKMDKGLQEPLTLEMDNSSVKFSGFLGCSDNRFAFQVDALLE